ncbi:MAG: lipid-A-disaccharide synthase N-terminal domain-containing protein [Phycisphaerales bacterium]|nr:lipid-A-disaccharide synthase N-terminal domain-containing protein [Phycisphaerales bacterium]
MMTMLAAAAPSPSMLDQFMVWANVHTAAEVWLLVFGVLGQGVFFMRWIVQWIASESRGESHVPEMFWWISLVGATMLFVYFGLRGEVVGLLGQSVGWTVYSRNLMLLARKRRLLAAESP